MKWTMPTLKKLKWSCTCWWHHGYLRTRHSYLRTSYQTDSTNAHSAHLETLRKEQQLVLKVGNNLWESWSHKKPHRQNQNQTKIKIWLAQYGRIDRLKMFKAGESLSPVSGTREALRKDKVIEWKARIHPASGSRNSVQSSQAWAQVVRYFGIENCMFEPQQLQSLHAYWKLVTYLYNC